MITPLKSIVPEVGMNYEEVKRKGRRVCGLEEEWVGLSQRR